MHARQPKPKATSLSSYSKDFIKHLSAASSVESTEGIVSENSFAAALDGLLEKATKTREKSYLYTAGLLQSYAVPEWSLADNQLTLSEAIKKSLRASNTERCLAARTAAIFAICLGIESESVFHTLQPSLESYTTTGSDESSKVEIICVWATLAFIAGDSAENLDFVKKCMNTIPSASAATQAAILHSIAFCCSSLPTSTIIESVIPIYGRDIGRYTSSSYDISVRLAAAQLVSLLFEFHRDSDEMEHGEYDPYVLDGYLDVTQIIEDLEQFKGKNKAEQKRVTILFAGYGASIEQGFCPFTEEITLQHATTNYSDWCSIIQVEWFRDYLQGGFHAHLIGNELLHQIFDIDPSKFTSKVGISKADKRDYKSKNSLANKERSKDRRRTQRKGIQEDA